MLYLWLWLWLWLSCRRLLRVLGGSAGLSFGRLGFAVSEWPEGKEDGQA